MWCINKFYEMLKLHQGLEIISSMITQKEINTNLEQKPYSYPVKVIIKFLESLSHLHEYIKDEDFSYKFINEASEGLRERFTEKTKEDLKEIEAISMPTFLSAIDVILKNNKKEGENIRRQIETTIIIDYLLSTNTAKQIQGITLISDVLRVNDLIRTSYYEIVKEDSEKVNKIVKTVEQLQLVGIVFCKCPQPEIMRKFKEIMRFIILNGSFTQEYINLMWDCSISKQDQTIFNFLSDIAEYAPFPVRYIYYTCRYLKKYSRKLHNTLFPNIMNNSLYSSLIMWLT